MTIFCMFIAKTVVLTECFSCSVTNLTNLYDREAVLIKRPCGSGELDFDSGIF